MIRGDAEGALEAIEVGRRRVLLDGGDRVEVYEEVAVSSVGVGLRGDGGSVRCGAGRRRTCRHPGKGNSQRSPPPHVVERSGMGASPRRSRRGVARPRGVCRSEPRTGRVGRRRLRVRRRRRAQGSLRRPGRSAFDAPSDLPSPPRDEGSPAQVAAALDWSLRPLLSVGRADDAAVFLGALSGGALAGPSGYPIVNSGRACALGRRTS